MDFGLLYGLKNALVFENLVFAFIGVLGGTLVGVLPGLGPASTLAILLPLTLYLKPTAAIIMLMAIYYGAQYGGSTTAILVNIPGEVSSVVTTLDGFPLSRQGRAASALAIAAVGSFFAGTMSIVVLSYTAPILAGIALLFGPPEYFGLVLLSLMALSSFSGRSLIKGIVAAILGLLLTTVGVDPLEGVPRFTFGNIDLMLGFDVVPVLVGLFGIGEVLVTMEEEVTAIFEGKLDRLFVLPKIKEIIKCAGAILRGSFIGFILGILPGMAASITTWIAYDVEKRVSKNKNQFGQGALEGVASPESANNATAISGMIPLIAFGIPTVPVLAILLAALQINGLQPGPLLFTKYADFTWTIIGAMYIGNLMCLILNLPLVGVWARLVTVPYKFLGPVILGICLVAGYSPRNNMFDVWVTLIFGVVGYLFKKTGWPLPPLVLGLILGATFEMSLRESMMMSGGDISIFLGRPIAIGLIVAGLVLIVIGKFFRKEKGRGWDTEEI